MGAGVDVPQALGRRSALTAIGLGAVYAAESTPAREARGARGAPHKCGFAQVLEVERRLSSSRRHELSIRSTIFTEASQMSRARDRHVALYRDQ